MSPAQFNDRHAKKEMAALSPSSSSSLSQLKINGDSHFIKKSSPSSSSSSYMTNKPQQRQPVIIYTHSPKIIHTHPKDFMALVQKLTGLPSSDQNPPPPKLEPANNYYIDNRSNKNNEGVMINDDNESVVTDENSGSTSSDDAPVNSCFVPPPTIFDPPTFNGIPNYFNRDSTDFLCTAHPYYDWSDSLFFMPTLTSYTRQGMEEFPDF